MKPNVYYIQEYIDVINHIANKIETDDRIEQRKYFVSVLRDIILRLEIDNGNRQ